MTVPFDVVDAWWRAANYLSVGQIYLRDNPLLRTPLEASDIKARLLGHWGTTPGINFIYAHVNRIICAGLAPERDFLFVTGPGHGGPANVANAWLEGTYSELYPVERSEEGMRQLFRQFSYPGGIPSHTAPETPGSINEGGELGYSLAHAFGAVFDYPDLVAITVVGDGEAETGALAASWHCAAFLDPQHDGAVLPILHLNGYKIANPTVLARMPPSQLESLLQGYGYAPVFVTIPPGEENIASAHREFAAALKGCLSDIRDLQSEARSQPFGLSMGPPSWPMIVLRSPKGWTGPAYVDGVPMENTWRAHQVPLTQTRENPEHRRQLESWLLSYRPGELFDPETGPMSALAANAPKGEARMSATPYANGGRLVRALHLPPYEEYALAVEAPGTTRTSPMVVAGGYLRNVIAANRENFRVFGPDETASNRLHRVYEQTDKVWELALEGVDEHLGRSGRVVEVLSENVCQGWLEGYLLTGRHGIFNCYEAFVHIVGSMFNQHAKWLKVHRELPWRQPIASFNYLLSSHVWQQDHNGFSHQDPGFVNHVLNKSPEIVSVLFPPDTNTLLVTLERCLASRDQINVTVVGKQPELMWLGPEQARLHCERGVGMWDFAGNTEPGQEPDAVLACAGDVPTTETVAAAALLREYVPGLKVRVINVVELLRLADRGHWKGGLSDREYKMLFTANKPTVFAFHGYPWLIHRLTYRRPNHENLHVRGFCEEGTTTTPFDMTMLNGIDRYQLAIDVIDRVPALGSTYASARQQLQDARWHAWQYTRQAGRDLETISGWTLP